MKLSFGKYKGETLSKIFEHDPQYVEWLYKNTTSTVIEEACQDLLFPKSIGKIEDIVFESLTYRGYSETEAKVFIRRLKKKE